MSVRTENSALLRQSLPPPALKGNGLSVRIGRTVKTGIATLFWIGGGMAVVTYGAALVYANVSRVEVDSAIVAGVIEAAQAPAAGRLQSNLVAGQALVGGERLFNVVNSDMEQQIGLASVRVERARSDLNQKIAERDSEKARRDAFLAANQADVGRTRAEVNAFLDLEKTAQSRYSAATDLFSKGYETRPQLEDATDKLASAKLARIQAENRLDEKVALFASVKNGLAYGGVEFRGRLADTEAAVKRAEAEVKLAADELRVLMERRVENSTTANAAGKVLRVLKLNGTSVQPGEPVAIIEREGDMIVYAFLTQSEVGSVSVNDDAEVVLPAQHLTAKAKVLTVERSGGYLDDVESRYIWKLARDPGVRHTDRDRTARVTLRFSTADQAVARRELTPGTPAFVSFHRSWEGSKIVEAYTTLGQLASRTMDRLAASAPTTPASQETKVSAE